MSECVSELFAKSFTQNVTALNALNIFNLDVMVGSRQKRNGLFMVRLTIDENFDVTTHMREKLSSKYN